MLSSKTGKVTTNEATSGDDISAIVVDETDKTDQKGDWKEEETMDGCHNPDFPITERAADQKRTSSQITPMEKSRLYELASSTVKIFQSFAAKKKGMTPEEKRGIAILTGRLRSKAQVAREESDSALGTLDIPKNQPDIAHVRIPLLANIILSSKFMLYRNRYADAQMNRTLLFPALPQPTSDMDVDEAGKTEMTRTRSSHRFIVTADTQYGVLMDGFPMENPNWDTEIDISRECVRQINSMEGDERPLFVCVCGDLTDTEATIGNAYASWKNVMKDWEREEIFEQQIRDWKEVWSHLDHDIGLVCLCGNHDVGNKPTAASINKWTSAFGNDYLAFWVNGTYNIGLNNCLFADPSLARDLYDEQLKWLEERLEYASARKASQIFVYSHYPWFIKDENEEPLTMDSVSLPPDGWGGKDKEFLNSYFNIPIENRKKVLSLFETHNVTACFSGHFHQNVVSKTSWGMPMIITGPLSMMLKSTSELSTVEEEQNVGFRIVDVKESSFNHNFISLNNNRYCKDCNNEERKS